MMPRHCTPFLVPIQMPQSELAATCHSEALGGSNKLSVRRVAKGPARRGRGTVVRCSSGSSSPSAPLSRRRCGGLA